MADQATGRRRSGGLADVWAGVRVATRRWARDTFAPDQLAGSMRMLAWIAPLTLLIWIYAEREQIPSPSDHVLTYSIRSADPNIVVTSVAPGEETLTAKLRGPQAQIDAIKALVRRTDTPAVELVLPANQFKPSSDEQIVRTSMVTGAEVFKAKGIEVIDVSPSQVRVRIDRLSRQPAEIVAPEAMSNVAGATFSPRTVEISGAESVLNRMKGNDGVLRATVILDQSDKRLANPGQTVTIDDLEVRPMEAPVWPDGRPASVSLSPERVSASIVTKEANKETTIPSVAIFVLAPPTITNRVEVQFEPQTIPNVIISGPPDIIDRIESKDLPSPIGLVTVTRDDILPAKYGLKQVRQVEIRLPPGVTLHREGLPEVQMTVSDPTPVQ